MNERALHRFIRREVAEYARWREQHAGPVGDGDASARVRAGWRWMAEWMDPGPEPPAPVVNATALLVRPDGTELEEMVAMRAKPESVITRVLANGELDELRAFVDACDGMPGTAKIRVVARIGQGSANGAALRDITAEVYPAAAQKDGTGAADGEGSG